MSRADYMTSEQKVAMGKFSRTHDTCLEKTGVARPGKTAHDKANHNWSTAKSKHGQVVGQDKSKR